jgi:hypothetical protein
MLPGVGFRERACRLHAAVIGYVRQRVFAGDDSG